MQYQNRIPGGLKDILVIAAEATTSFGLAAQACLVAVQQGDLVSYTKAPPLSSVPIRGSWEPRARYFEKNRVDTLGVQELIPALAAWEGDVCIHILEFGKGYGYVFTDVQVTCCIGVTYLP